MSGFTKPEHIEMAQTALDAYCEAHPDYRDGDEPQDQALTDLVCALLMLAAQQGHDPERLIRTAQMHYEAEG